MRGSRNALFVGALGASLCAAPVPAEEGWALSITPYLMLPGVDALVGIESPGGGAPSVGAGPSDAASLINMAVMVKAEARREREFLFVDWMYLDMGDANSVIAAIEFPDGTVPVGGTLTLDSDVSFDGFMVMAGGGYRMLEAERSTLDLYGGIRTLNLSTSLRWALTAAINSPGGGYTFPATGQLEGSSDAWDAVVGLRGSLRLAERWRAFGVADVGWGDGSDSWQAILGLSWRAENTSIEFAWREIAWHGIGQAQGSSLRLYGPEIGATFRF